MGAIFAKNNNNRYNMKYLIIGGVAGGATAAARMRRLTEDAEIILFEKGGIYRMPTVACLTTSGHYSRA